MKLTAFLFGASRVAFCLRASLALPVCAFAQSTPAPESEVIALPEFSVGAASNENSWVASSSWSGTRTHVPIQNLLRSIQVRTSESLADLGADNRGDTVVFITGVTSRGKPDAVFDNNFMVLRCFQGN